jgi:hypothetical protein
LWVIFALLDPDPDSEYEFGSRDLIESGSNPDPQPCFLQYTLRDAMRVEEEKRRLKGRIIASTRHNRFGGTFVLKNIQVNTYISLIFNVAMKAIPYLSVFFVNYAHIMYCRKQCWGAGSACFWASRIH